MNYWRFKFKEENWDWNSIEVGDVEDWDFPKLLKYRNSVEIGDIIFLYRTDANRGIYFVGKVIDITLNIEQPIDIEIIYEFKENIFRPEDNGYSLESTLPSEYGQNSTVYKLSKKDNPEKLYFALTGEKIEIEDEELIEFNEDIILLDELKKEEEREIEKALKDSSQARKERLKSYTTYPKKIKVSSYTYKRNPDIVAEALFQADGICDRCDKKAPFIRSSNDTPYLEVHHIKPLSKGGKDELDNVIALCPNCHRKEHFG